MLKSIDILFRFVHCAGQYEDHSTPFHGASTFFKQWVCFCGKDTLQRHIQADIRGGFCQEYEPW